MKVIITGSRKFPKDKLQEIIEFIIKSLPENTTHIICGEASGIDSLGEKYLNNFLVSL